MDEPLYMSYWVGMTPEFCSVQSNSLITATENLVTYEIPSINYKTRAPDTIVESCHYIIEADQDDWTIDSLIYIYLNATNTANMYVYEGSNRTNASIVI